jgi:hypothetical protein
LKQDEASFLQHATAVFNGLGLSPQTSQQLGRRVLSDITPSAAMQARIIPGSRGLVASHVQEAIPVGQMMLETQRTALAAQAQLESDVRAIETHNAPIQELNSRVVGILTQVSGQDLGQDRESWQRWLIDLFGYAQMSQRFSQDKPVQIEDVPLAYQPQPVPVDVFAGEPVVVRIVHSCFAAGTSVHTLTGPRPIETLQAGDQVLTQEAKTGLLTYQPIVAVYHNRPNQTLRIRLDGGEEIVATEIHRFWEAGKGWTMARDLKADDTLRSLGTTARVVEVANDRVQPVFNLRVAEGESFFVGRLGTLVHDNSLVEPTETPFDVPPNPAASVDRPVPPEPAVRE